VEQVRETRSKKQMTASAKKTTDGIVKKLSPGVTRSRGIQNQKDCFCEEQAKVGSRCHACAQRRKTTR